MMFLWTVVIVIAVGTAGLGFGLLCVKLRDRHIRLTLGISDRFHGDLGAVRARVAARYVADTEMRINAAAPHLKPELRRRLALALTRSRGLLPKKTLDRG